MPERQQVQRGTFYLLHCDQCGHASPPPPRFDPPGFVDPTREPMRCHDCRENLHLIECFTAPETTMWQVGPGAIWQHVIYPESLPRRDGRQLWMQP